MESVELMDKYASQFAAVLGETAPKAWDILVQGQFVSGLDHLLWGTVWTVVAYVLGLYARSKWHLRDHQGDMTTDTIFACIGCGLLFLFSTVCFSNGIREIGSPEYMALKVLLSGGK